MEKINFKKMFMGLALVLVSMFASQNASAQTQYGWNGIDTITVNQKVNIENQKVYVYGYTTAQPKNGKMDKKQAAAFASIGENLVSELKSQFSNTTFVVVKDASEAPSDGILVKACLTEMDWGSAALRTWVGAGAGNIHGKYRIQVCNGQGLAFELRNHRFHDTTFASAKGAAVVKVYTKAMAKDLATCFQGL